MNSHDFRLRWVPWDSAPKRAPRQTGVYLMRSQNKNPDIVYIGRAGYRNGGLRARLNQYHHPGRSQRTNQRIKKLASNEARVEVSWIGTTSAVKEEAALLARFRSAHGRLPIWNIVMPRGVVRPPREG